MTVTLPELALPRAAQDLLFREARTANAFTDEPVTVDEIRAVYDLVKFGPTAMNCQPLRITLVTDGEARQRLLPHMSEGNRAKTGAAPLVAILAADVDFHETLPEVFPHAPGMRDALEPVADQRESMARLSAGLQIGYFIVGVRAAGLYAGPMTGFDAAGVDKEFFDGTGLRSLVIVNIGHPAEDAYRDRLPRLDAASVVTVA
ncbi:malonic semialdehyde reductase [Mumia sp. zg.B17]|uniref:malonic semialdehyde reductase n=1 Tax=unclassified Mumia TaxID=2621872 RepID=UPI001C6F02A1|nr:MULTISPECIES: malonic semialdehyde reductase [unclassified Mumia]MBW9207274.1 malonic semialdehyde reductase [Mumia sp. zg.B17]MBW9210378.1 malonic semialdehyde reductase [Mumia sp. zg.B21]MDD9348993.1 malonic semialdehyde reductase [Mumia sp.]